MTTTLESLAAELRRAYDIWDAKRAEHEIASEAFERTREVVNAARSDWNIAHRAIIDFIEQRPQKGLA